MSAAIDAELELLRAQLSLDDLQLELLRAALLRISQGRKLFDAYEIVRSLGTGSMGEVFQVRDLRLRRTVAMKVLHASVNEIPEAVERFVAEAQVTAQLGHPGIVPVHQLGTLPDGRRYYLMQEMAGPTLADRIAAVHAVSGPKHWGKTSDQWTLRRLLDSFHAVCEVVGYAHVRGVIHRDLKPENIMVAGFGEVRVVDWGLARVGGVAELSPVVTDRFVGGKSQTRQGWIAGTPVYMAPEQARGEVLTMDARADVYALGCILYEIFEGTTPATAEDVATVLWKVGHQPAPLLPLSGRPIPEALRELCNLCLSFDPAARPANAQVLAERVDAWRQGEAAKELGRKEVLNAAVLGPALMSLRDQARELRTEARRQLGRLQPWDSSDLKKAGWELEDQAAALELEADLKEIELESRLRGALAQSPDLPEAHLALARHYRAQHRAAEERRDVAAARRAEARLRAHAGALPPGDPNQEAMAAYLAGQGLLSVHTQPAGVPVRLYRMELRDRRLEPRLVDTIGYTPIRRLALPQGSYQLGLILPGGMVPIPVSIGRQEHCDNVPPGETRPVTLLLPDRLGPDDCWVPAGWFLAGGDPEATHLEAQVGRRVWLDDFVIQRFPVTNQRYVEFLNHLVAEGREEEALACVPRERPSRLGELGVMIYGQDDNKQFFLRVDSEGDPWLPEQPVVSIPWAAARVFAAVEAARTGLPWRLPLSLEWEKAARGVDGRHFPWGDRFDPSWCCMRDSHKGRPGLALVTEYPLDKSPYGVRGMGGNTSDWCLDPVAAGGPVVVQDRPAMPDLNVPPSTQFYNKGGSWYFGERYSRSANLLRRPGNSVSSDTGIRLLRPLLPEESLHPSR